MPADDYSKRIETAFAILAQGSSGDDDEADVVLRGEFNRLINRIAGLEAALLDIANGSIPPDEISPIEQTQAEFRYQMWLWSQDRARQALGNPDAG